MSVPEAAGRLREAVGWIVVSRVGIHALSFVSTLVVVRLLEPSDYGLVALAAVWTHTAMWLSQLGMGAAIVQFRDVDDRELNVSFWLTTGLAAATFVLIYASAPAIERWFSTPRLSAVSRALAITVVLAALQVVPTALLRRRLSLTPIARAEILAGVLSTPTVLALAWYGAGVWALVMGVIVTQATQTIVTWAAAGWWPGFRMGGPRTRSLVRYGITVLGGQLCWLVYSQADVFVLGRVSGSGAVGLFSMAKHFSTVIATKIVAVVTQVASPVMADQQDDVAALRRSLRTGLRYVGWAVIPSSVVLVVLADPLVRVLLTEKWRPALPLIYVLSVHAVASAFTTLLPPVLNARYRVGWLLVYHGALLLSLPAVFWVGARGAGALGVALAWSLTFPLTTAWVAHKTLREIQLPWSAAWSELRAPMAGAVVMAAALGTLVIALEGAEVLRGPAEVVVLGAAAMVTYFGSLLAFGGSMRTEIVGILAGLARLTSSRARASS